MKGFITATVLVLAAASTVGCGYTLAGRWTGTGEVGEGRFFQFTLDDRDPAKVAADFQYRGAEEARLPVCGLRENPPKHVEFTIDADGRAQVCGDARAPLTFIGEYGADVVTGQVLGADGKRVGTFRAFRVPK